MPVPVITVSQMRDWEKATWSAGRTEAGVISRVGHIVTVRARQMTRPGDLIVILAGQGHNGDDARSASQNFADREIYLINVTEPPAGLDAFRSQLSLEPALIIDGLFGIGLNRPLSDEWIEFIRQINASGIPVLAIDTPSGLNADTGETEGAAIQAAVTLTLAAPKPGLLKSGAWPFVGRLEVAPDIGLIPEAPRSETHWSCPEDFQRFPPPRPAAGHKGSFGHLAIFAGSLGYHGAAVLAARGALRARPGLVTVFTCDEVYVPVAAQLQSAMVQPWRSIGREGSASGTGPLGPHWTSDQPGQPGKFHDTFGAVLFGPGLAAPDLPVELKNEMVRLWRDYPGPVLADASGLDWLPSGPIQSTGARVITPHPGEAARLLKTTSATIQGDRPAAVRELSSRFGDCWVILKGHQTMVGRKAGDLFVNSSGNPCLAQGGSGDVLAGYLAGLMVQPQISADLPTALRYGVWQHGAAADCLTAQRRNWILEDLLELLGDISPPP